MAVKQLSDGGPDGTKLGQSTSDLVAFHGSSPTDQYAAITAVGTSVPVAACATFGLTSTQLTAIITGLNSVIAVLQEKGLTA
jgi:hypothetical protein